MDDKIEIKYSKRQVKVILPASHFVRQQLSAIENYADAAVSLEESGALSLIYDKPPYSSSLAELTEEELPELKRLELAQKMDSLSLDERSFKVPYLHPKNIFVRGGSIRLLHYGLKNMMGPAALSAEEFLMVYKALVVSILRPKLDFELLIDGIAAVRDQQVQEIAACQSYDEVVRYIHKAYHQASQDEKKSKRLVSKRNWYLFTFGTGIFGTAALLLGGFAAYFYFWSLPVQQATVKAQSHFIGRHYDDVADDLEVFQTGRLGREAKYVLAASYVHLDDLSEEQKASVLNTITPSSEDNLLDYWIFLGRGNYKKALDLAQNIGDDQLTLHAYTNLYEQTREDKKMKGAEKQKKLDEYRKEIEELSKKLGVKVGGQDE
ncbi:type VII secretion protein EssB [Streptococcus panodentis]|uniref:Type VII secretion protein EssB n=1 Tax=Streptococcus panodentis TaxID=1581472 RepID=A0ABS5AZ46_9STRE|nr:MULTISPECIES: type VII secretion protein EssB [Streptococcus]KXT85438.1 putative secretion system component EssB/YukC [Streptococcus sp. DD11]MBP2621850.1 type VII secretion protein EssB [Streptococcus panodentis]